MCIQHKPTSETELNPFFTTGEKKSNIILNQSEMHTAFTRISSAFETTNFISTAPNKHPATHAALVRRSLPQPDPRTSA